MPSTLRHLVWFDVGTGAWIGEWCGRVPAPVIPAALIGDARLLLVNEWLQQTQRLITPSGSPYQVRAQAWDLDAWDDCPTGGAVCLDVTMYGWPVGDFVWAQFDGVDRILDFRESRRYLQLTPATLTLDANTESARPVRSLPEKCVLDITGTPLEPFYGRLFGRVVRRGGALALEGGPPDAGCSPLVQHALEAARVDLEPA